MELHGLCITKSLPLSVRFLDVGLLVSMLNLGYYVLCKHGGKFTLLV